MILGWEIVFWWLLRPGIANCSWDWWIWYSIISIYPVAYLMSNLKGIFRIQYCPLCSLAICILCINSHCGLNLLVFPVTGVSLALWCKDLTLPARREKNGGVVLEKCNIVLLIWLLDKSLNYCIEDAWNCTVFADRRTRRIYQPCTVDGPHSSNNPVN